MTLPTVDTYKTLLYQQQRLPVFQNRVYDTKEQAIACVTGDLTLVEDQETGLVHNAAFDTALVIYDSHYQNEQAASPRFRHHLDEVSGIILRTMGRNELVEVGCGKGFFLEMLQAQGVKVVGFDPTYEGSNPSVVREYFTSDVNIQAKGMILRHVLEHIQNPVQFLSNISKANKGTGLIYIEVPCFDWICSKRAWFDVFYEHVNYFRLSDFCRMFGRVIECGRLFAGQYLYVVADLATLRRPRKDAKDPVNFPSDFLSTLNMPLSSPTGQTAIWGGASKGVIFSILKQRAGETFDVAIDINPAKQGRFLPVSGLQVLSVHDAAKVLPHGSTVYVMNSSYLDEIREMSHNQYHYVTIDDN